MVFDVTPDHQAILSGLEMKVPLNKLVSLSKDRIQELSTAHGLRTFFLRTGERFQVFYATPDEQIVIPGVMWDGSGKNITRLQIAKIPGTKPEVQIEAPPAGASTSEQADKAGVSPLDMMQVVYAGTYGRVGAPHAWMLVDPQWQLLGPRARCSPPLRDGRCSSAVHCPRYPSWMPRTMD